MVRLTIVRVTSLVALFAVGCASEIRAGDDPQGDRTYRSRIDPATGRVIPGNIGDTRRLRSTMDVHPREDTITRNADGTVTAGSVRVTMP